LTQRDIDRLRFELDVLTPAVFESSLSAQALHGDASIGNLLRTDSGLVWNSQSGALARPARTLTWGRRLLDQWSCDRTRSVTISRAVPNIKSDRPAETRDFFLDLLGFEVAMDMGWVVTVASPTNRSAQVTIIGNDDMAAPGISVEVPDVDAVHARAMERGLEIAYSLRDEEWGVRRFMLREPSGTLVNVVSHRSG
jgi:catechol 2,3-dioxygenase-like lactoylglutathione lyase family enzyme